MTPRCVAGRTDHRGSPPGASSSFEDASKAASASASAAEEHEEDPALDAALSREWGEFLHCSGKKFFDFSEIRAEIIRETDRVCGRNKGVSTVPITLKIFSPHVLNLTLVDLPGITRIAVGDQPADIEAQVRSMCLEYVSKPSSIILAVSPATTDIANSDALQLAQEVDPEGTRTVGVITKLDLMDPGTDALDVLLGRVIPLRRGFVGVVCRSQRDIQAALPISVALSKEKEFFLKHPAYRPLAPRMGMQFLTSLLNSILMSSVRRALPDIKARITAMLMDITHDMDALGEPVHSQSTATQGGLLLSLLSRFAANFVDVIDGRSEDVVSEPLLVGGSRIGMVFEHQFARAVDSVRALEGISDHDIRLALRNAAGPRGALFVPEDAFVILVKRAVRRLEAAGIECVEAVYHELLRIAQRAHPSELKRFGELREKITDTVQALLRRALVPSQTMVSNLIHVELAHINIKHPDFPDVNEVMADVQAILADIDPENPVLPSTAEEDKPGYFDEDVRPLDASQRGASLPVGLAAGASAGYLARTPASVRSGMSYRSPVTGKPLGMSAERFSMRPPGDSPPKKEGLLPSIPSMRARLAAEGRTLPDELDALLRKQPSLDEFCQIELMKRLLAGYFAIVRKTFADMVPKTIMCFLVNHAKEHIQAELVRVLYSEAMFEELLRETDNVAAKRRACVEMRSLLAKALDIVNEVRDFHVVV
jgi:dynamin 1-like protein